MFVYLLQKGDDYMKMKRLTAAILALCLVLCLIPATTLAADTETVDYQYTGRYVHN